MMPFCSEGRGGLHLTSIEVDERVQARMSRGGPVGSVVRKEIGKKMLSNNSLHTNYNVRVKTT